jgi:thioester reductase-like protein
MTSSESPASFFITGSSGYIGGAILARLIETYPEAEFFVQYRQDSQESILKKFSKQITPIKGAGRARLFAFEPG